jgi:hypothetical protein
MISSNRRESKPRAQLRRAVCRGPLDQKGRPYLAERLRDGCVSLALKARIALYLEARGYTHEAASDEAAKYSGHSGRVGMYTAASEAGIAIEAVASLARHKSLNVAQKYARRADHLKRAPSKNPALAI